MDSLKHSLQNMAFRNVESKFNNFSVTNPFNKSRKTVDTSDLNKNKYFAIDSISTGKCLSVKNGFEGLICDFKGEDHQLWYWEGKCLRNKKYQNDNLPGIQLVLELHKSDYEREGWGKVYLSHKHEESNQIWTVIQDEIECNYRGLR